MREASAGAFRAPGRPLASTVDPGSARGAHRGRNMVPGFSPAPLTLARPFLAWASEAGSSGRWNTGIFFAIDLLMGVWVDRPSSLDPD